MLSRKRHGTTLTIKQLNIAAYLKAIVPFPKQMYKDIYLSSYRPDVINGGIIN